MSRKCPESFRAPPRPCRNLNFALQQGGVWSNLDISCEGVSIDEWIPQKYKEGAGLIAGRVRCRMGATTKDDDS
jgi:hypothetical protein